MNFAIFNHVINFQLEKKASGQIKVIRDDIDYSVVPGIQVFTSNNYVIQEAASQNKLVVC